MARCSTLAGWLGPGSALGAAQQLCRICLQRRLVVVLCSVGIALPKYVLSAQQLCIYC